MRIHTLSTTAEAGLWKTPGENEQLLTRAVDNFAAGAPPEYFPGCFGGYADRGATTGREGTHHGRRQQFRRRFRAAARA